MLRFPLIVRSCGAAPGTAPPWVTKLLDRFGLTNLATVQQKLADRGSQFLASQAIIIGQTTFEVIIKLFIMRRDVPRCQPAAVRCRYGLVG